MGNEWNIFGSNTKEKNILNIYILGESQNFTSSIFTEKPNFNHNYLYNWIKEFSNKGITNDILNNIIEEIKLKILKNNESNSIIIFLNKQDIYEKINLIINFMKAIKKVYKPIVILAIDEESKKELKNVNNEQIYNNNENNSLGTDVNILNIDEYIEIVYYKNNDYCNIENRIRSIYNYYYNVGDLLTNFVQMINDFIGKNEDFPCIEYKSHYKATFNILVMGRPGCGKSTLINLILNEKRAREGIGYSITKLYTQYLHKKYPITLTDTPGFEDDKAIKKMKDFLSNFSFFFKEGKLKFHLVLYLINASNERTFMSLEYGLINNILNSLNIPIFFVCTRAKTEEASLNFKEEVKINLIQNFGLETKLVEHIYCCNLLNEKDGIYKRFGLDKLFTGIKDYFSKDITKINFIKSEFKNIINMSNTNTYEDYELNILSSLEYSSSFKKYLTNLLRKIIEKYKTLISKINQNIPNLDEKLKKIYETLKKHLAFELNKDESEINDSLYEKCFATCGDFFSGNTENNIKKKYLDKINNIENFLVNNLNDKIKNFDSFMEEIINNYENSINSFLNINDNINKNEIY